MSPFVVVYSPHEDCEGGTINPIPSTAKNKDEEEVLAKGGVKTVGGKI